MKDIIAPSFDWVGRGKFFFMVGGKIYDFHPAASRVVRGQVSRAESWIFRSDSRDYVGAAFISGALVAGMSPKGAIAAYRDNFGRDFRPVRTIEWCELAKRYSEKNICGS